MFSIHTQQVNKIGRFLNKENQIMLFKLPDISEVSDNESEIHLSLNCFDLFTLFSILLLVAEEALRIFLIELNILFIELFTASSTFKPGTSSDISKFDTTSAGLLETKYVSLAILKVRMRYNENIKNTRSHIVAGIRRCTTHRKD